MSRVEFRTWLGETSVNRRGNIPFSVWDRPEGQRSPCKYGDCNEKGEAVRSGMMRQRQASPLGPGRDLCFGNLRDPICNPFWTNIPGNIQRHFPLNIKSTFSFGANAILMLLISWFAKLCLLTVRLGRLSCPFRSTVSFMSHRCQAFKHVTIQEG